MGGFFPGMLHGHRSHGSAFFYMLGQGARQGGGSYQISKLSNYQINKLTKGGLIGLSRQQARKAFIGTFTRFHRGRDLDAVASDLRF